MRASLSVGAGTFGGPSFMATVDPGPQGFCGSIKGVTLADLVQMACLSGQAWVLSIGSTGEGSICFEQGEVVHASFGQSRGEEAFFDLMACDNGTFIMQEGSVPEKTVRTPWNFLLIEALRRRDEKKVQRTPVEERRIRVLIVDDSQVVGSALERIFVDMEGTCDVMRASDGKDALDVMENHRPDLVTLDLDMPVMGGEVALKHIMIRSPAPVVLISGLEERNFHKAMEFMRLGAVDFIPKPRERRSWDDVSARLGKIVSQLSGYELRNVRRAKAVYPFKEKCRPGVPADRLVMLFAGFGGILEVQKILPFIPSLNGTSMILAQDTSPGLNPSVAGFLDSTCSFPVVPLSTGFPLLGSQCWVMDWLNPWEVVSDAHGSAIRRMEGGAEALDADHLLASASSAFGERLMVLVMTGATLGMEHGLDAVISKGGRVIFQHPDTALHPSPIRRLMTRELEEGCIAPEEGVPLIREWVRGTRWIP